MANLRKRITFRVFYQKSLQTWQLTLYFSSFWQMKTSQAAGFESEEGFVRDVMTQDWRSAESGFLPWPGINHDPPAPSSPKHIRPGKRIVVEKTSKITRIHTCSVLSASWWENLWDHSLLLTIQTHIRDTLTQCCHIFWNFSTFKNNSRFLKRSLFHFIFCLLLEFPLSMLSR